MSKIKNKLNKVKSVFTKEWILNKGIPIVKSYNGNLTLRALHYRLVAEGMTNDLSHYKKVVNTMIEARWTNDVQFDSFLDHERETLGETNFEITTVNEAAESAKDSIKFWTKYYRKNRWENQPYYPEVFIEKKALIGVFEGVCKKWNVALNPCKGYPSLTFQYDASQRFLNAENQGKKPIILYFGDYDPSGEDIPRSIYDTLFKLGVKVEVKRIALMKQQVIDWELPPAPTKLTDTRSGNWSGLGQVELDAVEPKKIIKLCEQAITEIFDFDLYEDLKNVQAIELAEYKEILKRDFNSLLETDEDE